MSERLYSFKDIADILGRDLSSVKRRANKENWPYTEEATLGGRRRLFAADGLPASVRKALEAQLAVELLGGSALQLTQRSLALPDQNLNQRQREAADARATVINAIEAMNAQGITKEAAMTSLLTQAALGTLAEQSPVLDKALRLAKDSRGRGTSAYPSVRSLKRWLSPKTKSLAPKGKQALQIPEWANDFLPHWQLPEKPTVEHAYRNFVAAWQGEQAPPSIHAVRRLLTKLGSVSRERGRMGPREIKNIMPFVRRSFDQLLPGDIYSADGHTFDTEVSHPLHGRPFKPEITTFIDIATRRAVGYSVDLAESSLAVLDALIDSCKKAIPAILYVDNGSGYCNALLKDQSTGVLARLGANVTHSLPYNSQARGVIERVHQTLWVDGAKALPGYIGKDMDREAALMHHRLSRKAIKENGKTHLLGWDAFVAFCDSRMAFYNSKPHASLPKITDAQGRRRNMTPDECWQWHTEQGWQAETLTQEQAAHVFRPQVTRTVRRGEVRLMNNIYFSHDLTEFHDDEVAVAFDIHDPQWVWVYDIAEQRLICKAEWNANQAHYMPMSYVEQSRDKRAAARVKRLEDKLEEVHAERRGNLAMQHSDPMTIPLVGNIQKIREQAPAPVPAEAPAGQRTVFSDMRPQQRFALHQQYASGELAIPDDHRMWFERYPNTREYRAMQQREEERYG